MRMEDVVARKLGLTLAALMTVLLPRPTQAQEIEEGRYVLAGEDGAGRAVEGEVVVRRVGGPRVEVALSARRAGDGQALAWTATGFALEGRLVTRARLEPTAGLAGALEGDPGAEAVTLRGEHRLEEGALRGAWHLDGGGLALSDRWTRQRREPVLLRAEPDVLVAGRGARVRLHGRDLDALGPLGPEAVDLGAGVRVTAVVARAPDALDLTVDVDADARPGRRGARVGAVAARDAVFVAGAPAAPALVALVDARGRSVDPDDPHDFKAHGPVEARVVGAGPGWRVEMRDPGDDAARTRFYAAEGLAAPVLAAVAVPAAGADGVARVALDGRDASPARRLLLAGRYEVVLTREGGDADRLALRVAPPRALLVHPSAPRDFNAAGMPDMELEVVTRQLWPLRPPHFRLRTTQTITARELVQGLEADVSALLFVGHSWHSRLWLYHTTTDAHADDRHASYVAAAPAAVLPGVSSEAVVLPEEGKPFRDVFLAVLFGCGTAGSSPPGARRLDLCQRLVDLGVDVVIGFEDEIPAWGAPYQFLLRFHEFAGGGADIEEAARAAAEACRTYCDAYGKRPMTETLRVVVAPGARREGAPLTLFPPRYGDAGN